MEAYYPITLKLSGKKAVIVGGGKVAERKIAGLLESQAEITVVAPTVSEKIRHLSETGEILWREKNFSSEDIQDAFLIFAATNNRNINKSIKEAASAYQLVLIADDPEYSDFHVPAQVKRGRLNIAVSTGGASPVLARRMKEQLEQEFDERYTDYLEFLFQARQRILQEFDHPDVKKGLLKEIVERKFLQSSNREADLLRLYEEVKNEDKAKKQTLN